MVYENKTGFPSVTDILRPYLNTNFYTEQGRDRGTAVHAAASAFLDGLYVPPLDSGHQPYFDSFRRWADLMVGQVIFTEQRYVDRTLGYCGQPDAVIFMRGNDAATLFDWKTAAADQSWWALQIAAYRHLVKEGYYFNEKGYFFDPGEYTARAGIETTRGATVRLLGSGRMAIMVDHPNYQQDLNVFISALNVWKFFNG